MTVGQQQQFFRLYLLDVDGILPGQRVSLGKRYPERLVIEDDVREVRAGRGRGEDGEVEPSVGQLLLQMVGKVLDQLQTHLRQIALQGRQQQRRQIGADRRRHTERAGAYERVPVGRCHLLHFIDFAQNFPSPVHDPVADRRHPDISLGALEHPHAEPFLESTQLAAKGRLAGVAALRRPAEMQLLGDSDQIFQVPCVHAAVLPVCIGYQTSPR